MTTARSEIVDLEVTHDYHAMARCVRRSFLCGQDEYTGKNFDHRKLWIVERLKVLASVFAIDVCAYAVMSNHVHLVLRVMPERAAGWSNEEVLDRVRRLCPTCVRRLDQLTAARRRKLVETWRARLFNISWFMAKLDEPIAREANREDGCRGRFWEGRFKARALIDEGALLTCMAYVDLNPVRANMAEGLEDSTWTSIRQRLVEAAAALAIEGAEEPGGPRPGSQPEPEPRHCPALAPMADDPWGGADRLPLSLAQYIALLEWTRGAMRQDEDEAGQIHGPPAHLVARSGLEPDRWLGGVQGFEGLGGHVGPPSRLRERAGQIGRRWLKGQGRSVVGYSLAA